MFAPSLTAYEIFAIQIKYKPFDLENEVQGQRGEKWDLRHSTGNVLKFHICELFRIVVTREHTVMLTVKTYTYIHTYIYIQTSRDRGDDFRQYLQSRFAKKH